VQATITLKTYEIAFTGRTGLKVIDFFDDFDVIVVHESTTVLDDSELPWTGHRSVLTPDLKASARQNRLNRVPPPPLWPAKGLPHWKGPRSVRR
jgi:hypothetical protein